MGTLTGALAIAFLLAVGFQLSLRLRPAFNARRRPPLRRVRWVPGLLAGTVALSLVATPWLAKAYGQPVDYQYGVGWHERAAQAGSAEAQYRLGRFYETGLETAPDIVAARRWYGRAAEQGHAMAQLRLARLLHEGLGGPVDLPGAVRWYDAAAAQGVPEAQYNLALLLERGEGVAPDQGAAARLYESAAQSGIAAAAGQLAIMLMDGRGVDEDKVTALAWLMVAADKDLPGAAALRDNLSAELGANARREAEARAAALTPR